jgi:hypothetical protein
LTNARNEQKISKLNQVTHMSVKSTEEVIAEIEQLHSASNQRVYTAWDNFSNLEILNTLQSHSFRERQPK